MIAGKINRDWYDGARCNGTHEEIEGWFSEMANADCEIGSGLNVWSYPGESGRGVNWLAQDRIDDICRRIDAQ